MKGGERERNIQDTVGLDEGEEEEERWREVSPFVEEGDREREEEGDRERILDDVRVLPDETEGRTSEGSLAYCWPCKRTLRLLSSMASTSAFLAICRKSQKKKT